MIDSIYENLLCEQKIVAKFATICEGKTWEQIALALYQIVNDIDTMSDACKEDTKAFQDAVMKLQARKNKYLFSPDGCRLESKVEENLTSHAQRELELAGLFDQDSDYEGMLGEAVLELMQTFSSQGHSGFSALLTADIFGRLVKWEPLTELTDNPNEWNDLREEFDPGDVVGMEFQSNRKPSCFSSDGGKTYYDLDEQAVEHEDEDGTSYVTYEGEKVMHTSKPHKE